MDTQANLHPIVRVVLGLGSLAFALFCLLAIVAIVLPADSEAEQADPWERVEAALQAAESRWQNLAMEEVREMIPVYSGVQHPTIGRCSVLARSEDGKYVIVEGLWVDSTLPKSMAPQMSSIALVKDLGNNRPDVAGISSLVRDDSVRLFRVQQLTQQVHGATWQFATQ